MKDLLTRKSAGARVECQVSPHQIPRPGHTRHTASHPRPPTPSHPLPVGGGWEGTEIREAPASLSTLWSELNYRITELPGTQKEQNDFINWNSANSESGGLNFYKSCCQHHLITCCLSKTFWDVSIWLLNSFFFFLFCIRSCVLSMEQKKGAF